MIFKSHLSQPLLHLKAFTSVSFKFPFSLQFFTTTSQSHSFTISYLINNLGFAPEDATKASKRVRFKTSKNPDSVLAFFRSHGFSDSQISSIVRRSPRLLSCNTHKVVLPKFEFLASKGADIVLTACKNPVFLETSLKNKIIPMYELVRTYFQSDKKAIDCLIRLSNLLRKPKRVMENLNLLRDEGISELNISWLIQMSAYVVYANGLKEAVDEVKELGFDPLKVSFVGALAAKVSLSKPKWNAKVGAFKRWGWSEEAVAAAFKKHPFCMMTSLDKINAMMSFWVNQLGWNSLDLVKSPWLFKYSLEKRIIPRASVIRYLLAKGLIKNTNLNTPFVRTEKLFLEKYVKSFKEETSLLLKLYQGEKKLNFRDKRED